MLLVLTFEKSLLDNYLKSNALSLSFSYPRSTTTVSFNRTMGSLHTDVNSFLSDVSPNISSNVTENALQGEKSKF
jgi:hypothetical protein